MRVAGDDSLGRRALGGAMLAMAGVLLVPLASAAQQLRLEGTVRCVDTSHTNEYGFAAHTLVTPRRHPAAAALTNRAGYYALGLRRRDVVDRTLTLSYLGSDTADVQRFFVGRESITSHGSVRLQTVNSRLPCEELANEPVAAERRLDSLRVVAGTRRELPGLAGGVVLASGTGSIVATGLRALGAAACIIGGVCGVGDFSPIVTDEYGRVLSFVADSFGSTEPPQRIRTFRGATLFTLGRAGLSENVGFSFSPSRDVGEAVLWNPAAIGLAHSRQVVARTDYNRFTYLGAVWPVTPRVGVGLGFLTLHQDERDVIHGDLPWWRDVEDIRDVPDSLRFDTDERLVVLGGSVRLASTLTAGLAVKYVWQRTEVLEVQLGTGYYSLFVHCDDRPIPPCTGVALPVFWKPHSAPDMRSRAVLARTGGIDADVAITWRVLAGWQVGVTAMNMLGTRFLDYGAREVSLRGVGLGITHQRGRLNVGSDVKVNEDEPLEVSVGLSYVLLNDLVARGGLAFIHPFPMYDEVLMRWERTLLTPWQVGVSYRWGSYTFGHSAVWGRYHTAGFRLRF